MPIYKDRYEFDIIEIPMDVVWDDNITMQAKIILGFLITYQNHYGKDITLTNEEIGEYMKVSKMYVARTLQKLKKVGYLEIEQEEQGYIKVNRKITVTI